MAYSRKRLRILQGILGVVVAGLVISGGWLLWYHYGWRTDTDGCLHASFRVPVRVTVQGDSPADGCTVLSSTDIPAVQIGAVSIESLPDGPDIRFALLNVTDPSAMGAANPQTEQTVADVLRVFVNDTSNGQTTLTTINGRHAAVGVVKSPDNAPSDYFSADIPYCPCTTEIALIDAGQNRLFRATAVWLNDDAPTARLSRDMINSVAFH